MQKVHRSACAIFLSRVSKGPKLKTHKQNQSPQTQSKNTKTAAKEQGDSTLYLQRVKSEVKR